MQAVALSPEYKSDRSYLSGGMAGQLVLTVGGRAGASTNANTTGAAAAAAGWLHNIGIGGNAGTDTVLHSGEGSITTIKWSLSGRYIAWTNETGIKFMRSNLHLGSHESDFAWKRMNNIARPNRAGWDEMAGVWKARIEWIDESGLEDDESLQHSQGGSQDPARADDSQSQRSVQMDQKELWRTRKERVVIGWGGTVWIVDVHPAGVDKGKEAGEKKVGRPEVLTVLRTDCIISGVSQLTANLLLVLAYVMPDSEQQKQAPKKSLEGSPRGGITRKRNALQPEMRIIDINTQEEVCVADTLTVSRYESLSATDYHLGVLPVVRSTSKAVNARGALEVIGGVGGTIWDAALYSTKFFSSAASVMSTSSTGDSASGKQTVNGTPTKQSTGPHPALLTRSMKIFIQSPYDCVLATKLTLSDHLAWLYEHEKYEEAWTLLEVHPEAAGAVQETSAPSTPTRSRHGSIRDRAPQGSLIDFFDDSSQTTASGSRVQTSRVENERKRIGNKWLKQLIKNDEWAKAGNLSTKVLADTADWEQWAWTFADAKHFDDFVLSLPVEQLRPPISSTIYEVFLGHYLSYEVPRFADLLERWPPELYDVGSVVPVVQSKLKVFGPEAENVEDEKHADWRLLMEALAKLFLADGHPRDALKHYIKLQDADAALSLIATHQLIDAVVDDIPGIILLRVSKQQLREGQLDELEEASLEPIRLLVTETYQGIIKPDTVLKQLSARKSLQPFQYFYLRALWNGDAIDAVEQSATEQPRSRRSKATDPLATEGKSLVNDSADAALPLFAEYDRPLLFEFLKASQQYTLSKATSICEKKDYVPELVYLLAKEGQTKKALKLIIDKLGDVSQAISFAKEQDDPDLWKDLLDLSMKKPSFIRTLLEQVGTAIDPMTLVRRIPEGLEIVGLREALVRMLREYELQDSISAGAARVLRSEVAAGMAGLHTGRKRGVRFDVEERDDVALAELVSKYRHAPRHRKPAAAAPSGAGALCAPPIPPAQALEPLVAFPCGHVFHLSCLASAENAPPHGEDEADDGNARLQSPASTGTDRDPALLTTFPLLEDRAPDAPPAADALDAPADDLPDGADRAVGPKVRFAEQLRNQGRVGAHRGCPLEVHQHQ